MAKSKRLVALFSLAGTVLALAPAAAFAQERLRQVYVPPVYIDCYYNVGNVCGPAGGPGAYAAIGPVDAYAAVGVAPQQPYYAPTFWRGLRGSDWIAIHGANQ